MTERRALPTAFEVAIGAHLHDIGKFMQRAIGDVGDLPEAVRNLESDILPSFNNRSSHYHALFSEAFFQECVEGNPLPAALDKTWIRDCAVYHHKPLQDGAAVPNGSITWLVTEADRIAAAMERKKRDEDQESSPDAKRRDDYRRTRLMATPTKVHLPDRNAPTTRFYPVAELSPAQLFKLGDDRKDQETIGQYQDLWKKFVGDYAELADRAGESVDAYVEGLIALSERYCWSIPSSTIDDPDVSLHDHGRVAAAVAACLQIHHASAGDLKHEGAVRDRARPKFRLLIGDLSGIQASLFRLKSEGVKGLARLLRGRSFRMQMIGEAAARRSYAAFGLPAFSVIQLAGGRFLMLVPETGAGRAEAIVASLRGEIDAWMRAQYVGDLVLNLALTAPVSANDLIHDLPKVYAQVAEAAETAKLRPLQTEALGVVDLPFDVELGICEACGVRPAAVRGAVDERARCPACEAETNLGRRLTKADAIAVSEKRGSDNLFGLGFSVLGAGDSAPGALGFRRRGLAMSDGKPAADRFFEAYTPKHDQASLANETLRKARRESGDDENPGEGELLTFAELAAYSRREVNGHPVGRPMLALLKADVDNLGSVFSLGLGDRRSLSRAAALSRLMDAFFTGWLPDFLREKYANLYTVYAGGDDMMLLGPWFDVLRFAADLRGQFAAFAGGNPSLTLSAGVALFDPKTPISLAAIEAEARLDAAKHVEDNKKDRISAIGPVATAMTWGDWSQALEQAEELDRLIADGKVSTTLLYRLLALDDRRMKARTDPTCADWRAKLGYTLFRSLPKGGPMDGNRTVRERLMGLMGVGLDLRDAGAPPYARVAITIAIYRNR